MLTFIIKVHFTTGDSYQRDEKRVEVLDYSWTDLAIVKENCQRILRHELYYRMAESTYHARAHPQTLNMLKEEPWFTGVSYELYLLDQKKQPFKFVAPWVGYFEQLIKVKIKPMLPHL